MDLLRVSFFGLTSLSDNKIHAFDLLSSQNPEGQNLTDSNFLSQGKLYSSPSTFIAMS
jgi:hypothetical protein